MDEEQLTQLVSELLDLSDDEIIPYLTNKGIDEEQIDEILEVLEAVANAEDKATDDVLNDTAPSTVANDMTSGEERVASDNMDAIEQTAAKMADEDDTKVTVTEEDKDKDGDSDKVTVEKKNTEDDDEALFDDDKPHDAENSTNSIAQHLSQYRY